MQHALSSSCVQDVCCSFRGVYSIASFISVTSLIISTDKPRSRMNASISAIFEPCCSSFPFVSSLPRSFREISVLASVTERKSRIRTVYDQKLAFINDTTVGFRIKFISNTTNTAFFSVIIENSFIESARTYYYINCVRHVMASG